MKRGDIMKIKNVITSIYISVFTVLFIISGFIIYNQVSKTVRLQLESTQEKILEKSEMEAFGQAVPFDEEIPF